jgi:hypothetical protein
MGTRAKVGAACVLLLGCPSSPTAPGGVPQGGSFQHDPNCTLDGALTITLGDDTTGFAELSPGLGPVMHFGPQGGSHSFVGVRIGGLALDRYDIVLLELAVFAAEQCGAPGTPCSDYPAWGVGRWVLGDDTPFEQIDEHTLEQDQLVVSPGDGAVVLQAQVEDPCGQVGFEQHPFSR